MARAALAFALALACHLGFAGLLVFLSLVQLVHPPRRQAVPPRAVTLRPLSAAEWARNRGEKQRQQEDPGHAGRLPREPKEKEEQKKPEPTPQGQVVAVAPGNGKESPEAKYLSESANRVEKETRAREQTAFYRNAMPRRTATSPQDGQGADAVDRIQLSGNEGLGDDDRPLVEPDAQRGVLELPSVEERQEVALRPGAEGAGPTVANRSESAKVVGNSDRLHLAFGKLDGQAASPGRKGKPGEANLLPSSAVLDKISGAAANDHLQGLEEGEGTYLNTKEWKYSSFFNRVKQSVGMHWNPGQQLRVRDPSGNIYGGRDRYTVLSVTLNDQGLVKDVLVEKSCGLDFLDLEAIHSFQRAQPFPNPPPGLLAEDSRVRFSFGFFLEMGGGPRIRLFRSAN